MVEGYTYRKYGLLWLLLLGGFYLCTSSEVVYADTSINVSLNSDAIVLDLMPLGANGSFAKSDDLTIDVSISGPGGYTIGVSSTGSTNLVNQRDNTKVLSSIIDPVSESDFAENSTTAANNCNGKWGYLPSKFQSLNNSLYLPLPGEEGDILDTTHGTNDVGQYAIAIGARASMDTMAGAYSNTFVITAVANYSCSVGEVCYFDNGAEVGVMENQVIPVGDTEVELVGSRYHRDGYGFAGWSTTMLDPDDADFESDFAAATVYGPMETVTIPAAGYLPLYAVWVPSSGDMQAWDGCGSMNTGDVIGLTDTRDGEVYAVGKLVDGQCWQLENLRLDFSDEDLEITNLNTNHPTADYVNRANVHPSSSVGSSDAYSRTFLYYTDNLENNYPAGVYYNYYTFRAGNDNPEDRYPNSYGDICPAGWHITDSYYGVITGADYSEEVENLKTFPSNFVKNGYFYNWITGSGGFFYPLHGYGDQNYIPIFRGMFNYSGQFYPDWTWTTNVNYSGFSFRCVAGSVDTYTLSYDANGGSNAPSSESISSTSGVFEDITTSVPTRSGYTFVGWVDNNGIEIQPGGDYNAGVGNTEATLYAMWSNNACNSSATTIGTGNSSDAICMQDMNGAVRTYMSDENTAAGSIQTYQLVDARDNESYDIALLDDDVVWMTKNLNLGRNSAIALSYVDTNLPEDRSFILKTNAEMYYDGELYDGYYNGVFYGGYYSWYAATASGYYIRTGINVSTSICPSKWVLPTKLHYADLISSASITNNATASVSPYNFSRGGSCGSNSCSQQGTTGYYWTSTGYSYTSGIYAVDYRLASNSFQQYSNSYKTAGESVRCVFNSGTVTISYDSNDSSAFPATGSVSSKTLSIDTGNIASNGFSRDGYVFRAWNTEPDGTGVDIAPGADVYTLGFSDGDDVTLYAQWTPQAAITYDDNYSGKKGTSRVNAGSSTTLGAFNYFTTKTGYSIKEWNTEPDGSGTTYAVSSSYSVPADLAEPVFLTLYAQWVEDCTITYVNTITNETQIKTVKWNQNSSIAIPVDWTQNGYRMAGWDTVTNGGASGGGTVVYATNATVKLTEDLTIYTVWVPTYTIQYNGNGASGSTSMTVTHQVDGGEEIILRPSNYSNSGYGFAGWSFDPDAADDLANATVFGPNAIITAPALTIPGEVKTLYAVWVEAESGVTMQTFDGTASPYDLAEAGSVIALTDSRDGDTYAVAKLDDGKWWMIENLRLGGTSSTALNTSTSAIANDVNLPASISNFSTSNYSSMQVNSNNKTSTVSVMENTNSNVYSYGGYYSWNAAIGSSSVYTTDTHSICPYGWRLPTGSSGGDFYNLSGILSGNYGTLSGDNGIAGSRALRTYPNNFIYSGRKSGSSVNYGSSYYWSSYASSGNSYRQAGYLYITSNTVYPISTLNKYYGLSVRCIAGSN